MSHWRTNEKKSNQTRSKVCIALNRGGDCACTFSRQVSMNFE